MASEPCYRLYIDISKLKKYRKERKEIKKTKERTKKDGKIGIKSKGKALQNISFFLVLNINMPPFSVNKRLT